MKVSIEKKEQHFSFEAQPGQKLLYAGLQAGIPLPYECATGTCGTCRARVKEGEVVGGWPEAPGRKGLKQDRREFLLCQAYLRGEAAQKKENCVLGVPSAIKQFREDDIAPVHLQGKVQNWKRLNAEVLQFDVVLISATRFHAGQFFVIQAPGIEGFRAYSMVNYASETSTLTFVLKNKQNGAFSKWAFDKANEAGEPCEILLFGPLGRATFHPDEASNLFLVAGGSGIAGLMSILRHAAISGHFDNYRATLFFGVRTADDTFYLSELNEIVARFRDQIKAYIVFSDHQSRSEIDLDLGHLNPAFGFVHEQALAKIEPNLTDTIAYLAGPPPMVDALIRPLITEAKLPANKIRYDKFG